MEKRLLWGRNREFYFYDMYVERFLSSFYRTGKIIDTLEAVSSGFPPGSMKKRIEKALRGILTSKEVGDVERTALTFIEAGFENPFLLVMHQVCLKAEDLGKDAKPILRLLMRLRSRLMDKTKDSFRKRNHISIEKEFQNQFFIWLSFVLLYLQEESVYVAIYRSYDDAPELIQPAVKSLIFALKEHPDEVTPYDDFFREYPFDLIRSVMLYLYSVADEKQVDFENAIYEIITEKVRRKGRRNI